MNCQVKHCNELSIITFYLYVTGFPQKELINFCEKHASLVGEEEVRLKSGGYIEPVEKYVPQGVVTRLKAGVGRIFKVQTDEQVKSVQEDEESPQVENKYGL